MEFLQVLAKHDFLYYALYLSKRNISKLSILIKIYKIRCYFCFCLKKKFENVFSSPYCLDLG